MMICLIVISGDFVLGVLEEMALFISCDEGDELQTLGNALICFLPCKTVPECLY